MCYKKNLEAKLLRLVLYVVMFVCYVFDLFLKAKLIFGMLGGSHQYGLNLPTSDFDIVGVYMAPSVSFLG